ncbi:transposase [Moorena sp. SIO1G6]|uniref:transposase n=1 Tax=Moorena sp. SIO1G6 TaxID=2607840 RepID=UPI00257CF60D|nr:transposase [Moorena sp. SIO1G6]
MLEDAKADLGENDHIHLLIDLAPKVSISKLCNTLKTVTSREIRKRYAKKRIGSLLLEACLLEKRI